MSSPRRTATPLPIPRPMALALQPFQEFFKTETAGGVLLLAATAVALFWANSRWGGAYRTLLEQQVTIGIGVATLKWSLGHWINDALMAVFFLLVGLEIKRELVLGELNTFGKAVLPAIAAAGGMAAPAAIYVALNWGTPGMPGWGVPVATDIAFALGCLALLKGRVPASLAVFLTALAIFDDLGAILVIALFYGHGVQWGALAASAAILALLGAMTLFGVRRLWPYLVVGLGLWVAVLLSGIHATIAGVLLGLMVPARAMRGSDEFARLRTRLRELEQDAENEELRDEAINSMEEYVRKAQAPLDRLVHALHPLVAFVIVPVFALANAGISLEGLTLSDVAEPVSLGVALGLFFGKQVGIFGATWLAVRLRLSPMPSSASWKQVYGIAILGGIGFTMSLFISALAFEGEMLLTNEAKVGILLGSFTSAAVGLVVLRVVKGQAVGSRQ